MKLLGPLAARPAKRFPSGDTASYMRDDDNVCIALPMDGESGGRRSPVAFRPETCPLLC